MYVFIDGLMEMRRSHKLDRRVDASFIRSSAETFQRGVLDKLKWISHNVTDQHRRVSYSVIFVFFDAV